MAAVDLCKNRLRASMVTKELFEAKENDVQGTTWKVMSTYFHGLNGEPAEKVGKVTIRWNTR